jgi:hypothetical protein
LNPVSDIVSIKFEENKTVTNGDLRVTNTLGQLIYQQIVTDNTVQINTQLWAAGTYIVSAKINGSVLHKQIVKIN